MDLVKQEAPDEESSSDSECNACNEHNVMASKQTCLNKTPSTIKQELADRTDPYVFGSVDYPFLNNKDSVDVVKEEPNDITIKLDSPSVAHVNIKSEPKQEAVERSCYQPVSKIAKTNAENCKNYYNRKKAAKEAEKIRQGLSLEKPRKKTGAERTRAYRLRKMMLSQVNESASNSEMRAFEPSFQSDTTIASSNRSDVSTVSSTHIADHDEVARAPKIKLEPPDEPLVYSASVGAGEVKEKPAEAAQDMHWDVRSNGLGTVVAAGTGVAGTLEGTTLEPVLELIKCEPELIQGLDDGLPQRYYPQGQHLHAKTAL